METTVNILILEHDQNDIGLLLYELKKSGLNTNVKIVQTKEDYEFALSHTRSDIILSDYSLPSFDGLTAFRIKQEISPETPFIIVSGTIGEENAVELIKTGVTDYVLKEKMYQITPKINRALKESEARKQREIAVLQLKQREEQLRKIMDLSLDVICTINGKGSFITVGAASNYVWGFLPEELIGKSVLDLVHQEDKEKTYEALNKLRYGIDMVNFENRYIRKNGEAVTLFWSARWDPNDKVVYTVARDATDIKKAEEQIKKKERRFRTLLQNSTDGLTLLTADGTVIERSASALKIFGFEESDTSGELHLDLVHPDDLPAFNEIRNRVLNNPSDILTIEYRFYKPDGSYKWLESTLHNQLHEPAVEAIVLNTRDITERKLAEIALEKSEEKYRNLFNLSPIPMWVYESNRLCFLDVNEAAVRQYGYTKDEFLGMTLKDIQLKENLHEFEQYITVIKNKGGYFQSTSRHIKKSGEYIHTEVHGNSIEVDGKEARIVVSADISDRVKYITAIEDQNKKLREIAWLQSHVARAPVARIMGLICLLNKYQLSSKETTDILNKISTSAHELDNLIREIVMKSEHVTN